MASALDWVFADSDPETARIDWKLMSAEERSEISDMLGPRVIQFAYFLRALYGEEGLKHRFEEALVSACAE